MRKSFTRTAGHRLSGSYGQEKNPERCQFEKCGYILQGFYTVKRSQGPQRPSEISTTNQLYGILSMYCTVHTYIDQLLVLYPGKFPSRTMFYSPMFYRHMHRAEITYSRGTSGVSRVTCRLACTSLLYLSIVSR